MLTLCHSHQILKYKHGGSGSVLRGLSVGGFAAERTGAVEGNRLERRPRERGKRSQVLEFTAESRARRSRAFSTHYVENIPQGAES